WFRAKKSASLHTAACWPRQCRTSRILLTLIRLPSPLIMTSVGVSALRPSSGPRAASLSARFSTDFNFDYRSRLPVARRPTRLLRGTAASLHSFQLLFLLALTYARRLDNMSLRGVSLCGAASPLRPA